MNNQQHDILIQNTDTKGILKPINLQQNLSLNSLNKSFSLDNKFKSISSKNAIPSKENNFEIIQKQKENSKISFQPDDFKFLEKIGSGKFGNVYKAIELKSQQQVAIKKVKKSLLDEYDFYSQMRKELEIHWRLSEHPNIAKVFAYFYDKEYIYTVLEFAPEGNLYQKLRKAGKFEEAIVIHIIKQIIAALWYCQERNVIHRDIKPENILVMNSNNWFVKLCDFGWSTHSINQSRTTFCGTPDYLAPELLNEKPYDDKIDNWALGILTYELLTGLSPFSPPDSKDKNDIYRNIKNLDLRSNAYYEEHVNPLAKDFISQILKVNPGQRPSLIQISEHPWINS